MYVCARTHDSSPGDWIVFRESEWLMPGRDWIRLCRLSIHSQMKHSKFISSLHLAKYISIISDLGFFFKFCFVFCFFNCIPQEAKITAISRVKQGEKLWMKFRENRTLPLPKPPKLWPLEEAFDSAELSAKPRLCGQRWLGLSLKVYKECGSFYSNCPKLCFNFHIRIWNLVLFLVLAITV